MFLEGGRGKEKSESAGKKHQHAKKSCRKVGGVPEEEGAIFLSIDCLSVCTFNSKENFVGISFPWRILEEKKSITVRGKVSLLFFAKRAE